MAHRNGSSTVRRPRRIRTPQTDNRFLVRDQTRSALEVDPGWRHKLGYSHQRSRRQLVEVAQRQESPFPGSDPQNSGTAKPEYGSRLGWVLHGVRIGKRNPGDTPLRETVE